MAGLLVGFSASSAFAASRMAACCCSLALRPRCVLAVDLCMAGGKIFAFEQVHAALGVLPHHGR